MKAFKKFLERLFCSHELKNIQEVGAIAVDLIAGYGLVEFQAHCVKCKRTVCWTEEN